MNVHPDVLFALAFLVAIIPLAVSLLQPVAAEPRIPAEGTAHEACDCGDEPFVQTADAQKRVARSTRSARGATSRHDLRDFIHQ